jgi:hypothetical protein
LALCHSVSRPLPTCVPAPLQHSEEHADDKGDVLLTAQRGEQQLGLWANVHKNARFKLVDFGGLGMSVEIPKQLALANIALRVQVRPRRGWDAAAWGVPAQLSQHWLHVSAWCACRGGRLPASAHALQLQALAAAWCPWVESCWCSSSRCRRLPSTAGAGLCTRWASPLCAQPPVQPLCDCRHSCAFGQHNNNNNNSYTAEPI